MKKKNYNDSGTNHERSKLRYIRRIIEDEEAKEEISTYVEEEEQEDDVKDNDVPNKIW